MARTSKYNVQTKVVGIRIPDTIENDWFQQQCDDLILKPFQIGGEKEIPPMAKPADDKTPPRPHVIKEAVAPKRKKTLLDALFANEVVPKKKPARGAKAGENIYHAGDLYELSIYRNGKLITRYFKDVFSAIIVRDAIKAKKI